MNFSKTKPGRSVQGYSPRWLFVMKVSFVFSMLICLHFSVWAFSQTNISLMVKKEPLKEVLNLIEKGSDYRFLYNDHPVFEHKKVTLKVQEASLADVMKFLLEGTGLRYYTNSNNLVILSFPQEQAPKKEIKGAVKNEKGEAIPNVSINIKGKNEGTTTDQQGRFSLEVEEKDRLVISAIGYETQEVAVADRANLEIVLKQTARQMDEVVVVGYGTQKKANLTGATDRITAKQLESRPLNNLGSGLQGLIPNLNITTSNGRPNTASNLNIRGAVSINGGEPLILVDNIPATQEEAARLNPSDVESVTVLKDAASAAIYGARASFGVILITTKSAKSEKLNVNVHAYTAYRTIGKLPEVVTDPYTAITLKNQAAFPLYNPAWPASLVDYAKKRSEDPSLPPVIVNPNDPTKYLYMGNTDWLREGYSNKAPTYNVDMNISKKSDKIGYFFSSGYYQQDGALSYNTDVYKRYTLRGKVDLAATNWLKFSNNTSFANILYNAPTYLDGNYYWNLNRQSAFDVPTNPDGSWTNSGANQLGAIREGGRSDSRLNDFQSMFAFTAALVKDIWSLKGDATFRRSSSIERRFEKPVPYKDGPNGPVKYAGGTTGSATDNNRNTRYNVYNIYTDAHKDFGDHYIGVLAGFNQEEREDIYNRTTKTGLISYNLPTVNLSTGTTTASETIREWAVQGLFGRLGYNFKNRYLLELNGRYDGSSRFPKNDRWGFFPSVSAGWVASDESFFAPIKHATGLDFFKLRASYGSLGNQAAVGEYGYIPSMSFTQQVGQILGTERPSTVNPPAAVSSSYTWEDIQTINFGTDLTFFKNRLEINFDKYTRKVNGMLVPGKTLPNVFGAGAPRVNAGDMETKGFELKLSWRDQGKLGRGDFFYNITAALADSRAWVTRFDNPTKSLNNYYEGQELGEIWGLDVEGFFQSQQEIQARDYSAVGTDDQGYQFYVGDIKYADKNKDNKVNFGKKTADDHGDYYVIGNSSNRLPYSFDASGGWKGIDLRIFLQGVGRKDWYARGNHIYFWGIYAQPWTNVTKQNLDHWTPENPNAYFPRIKAYAAEDTGEELGIPNTRYLQNASYLRCKNLTLGYTLPQRLLRKAGLEKLRFYASAENLFEFTHLKVKLDPEGLDGDVYPFQRTYSFGLNMNF